MATAYVPTPYVATPYVGTPYTDGPVGPPAPYTGYGGGYGAPPPLPPGYTNSPPSGTPQETPAAPPGGSQQVQTGAASQAMYLQNQWASQAELTAYQQQLQMQADARKNAADVSDVDWERSVTAARTAYETSMAEQQAQWGNQAQVSQTDYMRAQALAQQAYQRTLDEQSLQWGRQDQLANTARSNQLSDASTARTNQLTDQKTAFSMGQTADDAAAARAAAATREAQDYATQQRATQFQNINDVADRIGGAALPPAPAAYVAPPPPTWSATQGAIDAAFNKAKETTAQTNRASLNGLRDFTASTGRMGSGYEADAAGAIFSKGDQDLSNIARDNLVADATAHNAFDQQAYSTDSANAKAESQSQYDIWNSQASQAAAKRQSMLALYTAGGY